MVQSTIPNFPRLSPNYNIKIMKIKIDYEPKASKRILCFKHVVAYAEARFQGKFIPPLVAFDMIIAQDGSGDFTTIREGISSAPNFSPTR
ncbi:hypothetical protein CCACVL1_22097 [Corchorus capsularis]|uniref:Uncharacterized protein n=1 Tax=Corchorus capsularis TaxID=210143 RepID=A0A1R3H0Y6_COCAP|nr:hypothetical protein CCACVL1_22097 [Corchorus capsularis]